MTTRMEGVADSKAPPDRVWSALVDAKRMHEWFAGVKDVETSDGWPAKGGAIRFNVMGSKFAGRVVESEPPRLLVLDIDTPSARSRVTSRIEPAGAGSRYHRIVDAEWKGAFGRVLGRLFIAPSVKREARKLAGVAEK